jgi:hypothetical protein
MNFRIAKKYPKKNGDSALLNHSTSDFWGPKKFLTDPSPDFSKVEGR